MFIKSSLTFVCVSLSRTEQFDLQIRGSMIFVPGRVPDCFVKGRRVSSKKDRATCF